MNKTRFQETGYLWYDSEVHKAFFYDHDYIQRIYKVNKDGVGAEIWNMQGTDYKHQHKLERNTAITCGRDEENNPLTTVRIDLVTHKVTYNPFGILWRFINPRLMCSGVQWHHKSDRDSGIKRDLYFLWDRDFGIWVTNDFQFYKQFKIRYNGEFDVPIIIGLSKDSIVTTGVFKGKIYIVICHYDDIINYKNYGSLSSTSCFLGENPILIELDKLKEDYNVQTIVSPNDSRGYWSTAYTNTIDYAAESRICIPVIKTSGAAAILGIDTGTGDVLYCTVVGSSSGYDSVHSLLTQNDYVTYILPSSLGGAYMMKVDTETGETTTSYQFGDYIPGYSGKITIYSQNCIELGNKRYYYVSGNSSTDYDYIINSTDGLARYRKGVFRIPVYDLEGELIDNHYISASSACSILSTRNGSSVSGRGDSWPGLFYNNSNDRYESIADCGVACGHISLHNADGTLLPITCYGYFVTTNIMAMDETNTFFCAMIYE